MISDHERIFCRRAADFGVSNDQTNERLCPELYVDRIGLSVGLGFTGCTCPCSCSSGGRVCVDIVACGIDTLPRRPQWVTSVVKEPPEGELIEPVVVFLISGTGLLFGSAPRPTEAASVVFRLVLLLRGHEPFRVDGIEVRGVGFVENFRPPGGVLVPYGTAEINAAASGRADEEWM